MIIIVNITEFMGGNNDYKQEKHIKESKCFDICTSYKYGDYWLHQKVSYACYNWS